jgi:hypothetical protein
VAAAPIRHLLKNASEILLATNDFACGFGMFMIFIIFLLYWFGKLIAKVANTKAGRAVGQATASRFLRSWWK